MAVPLSKRQLSLLLMLLGVLAPSIVTLYLSGGYWTRSNVSIRAADCKQELNRLRAMHLKAAAGGSGRRLQAAEEEQQLKQQLAEKNAELKELSDMRDQMREKFQDAKHAKARLDNKLTESKYDWSPVLIPPTELSKARKLLAECSGRGIIVAHPNTTVWKGYSCDANDDSLKEYFDFYVGNLCPDDWFLTQHLVYVNNCFAIPKRRCFNRTPAKSVQPVPFPASLFSQDALDDNAVRWNLHSCKSFECLNTRSLGDCRNCFNMRLEKRRWQKAYRGSISMLDVVSMKKGSLRIGLDAGGGTGSFAAHMALFNVTVMTTAMNIETVKGRMKGLPYMETIALRGLIPLFVPHKSRLPFFDNTLDIIHCVNSIKYLPMLEFEELLFEWDRVLRVGGVLWFEMFYAPVEEMYVYVAIIEALGYKKLHWNVTPKPDFGERTGAHLYLNCVLEKGVRKD